MRMFNPEKELKKIQKGNKNKIIIGVISLLLVVAIGSSYALYQIKYDKRVIYTQVDNFSNKNLAIYVDDSKQDAFPDKSKYYFDKVVCDNNSTWEFDYEKWELTLTTNKEDKCNIYFTKNYRDKSGANTPELYQGLIPIYFDQGNIYIADVEKEWYNYNEHKWGNAVLIDYEKKKDTFYDENGKLRINAKIEESDILQMYVWIPRYKYQLWNVIPKSSAPKQIINIKFESGISNTGDIECTYINEGNGIITENCLNKETKSEVQNQEWYTHPAFTFGETELEGFWVGKFEPSDAEDAIGRNENDIGEIIILPNKTSMVNKSISTAFFTEQALNKEGNKYNLKHGEVDTRIMKNSEWGAVAYLTQSIYGIYTYNGEGCTIEGMNKENCEIWINNAAQGIDMTQWGGTYTGCVGGSVSAEVQWNTEEDTPAKCEADKQWNTGGVKASTTGNMYGIYDMNGGASEYMMGLITEKNSGVPYYNTDYSGLSVENMPNQKYYDLYGFSDSFLTHERGHLGDATRETLATYGSGTGGWNSDNSYFPLIGNVGVQPFFRRERYTGSRYSGIVAFSYGNGAGISGLSFRSILSAA